MTGLGVEVETLEQTEAGMEAGQLPAVVPGKLPYDQRQELEQEGHEAEKLKDTDRYTEAHREYQREQGVSQIVDLEGSGRADLELEQEQFRQLIDQAKARFTKVIQKEMTERQQIGQDEARFWQEVVDQSRSNLPQQVTSFVGMLQDESVGPEQQKGDEGKPGQQDDAGRDNSDDQVNVRSKEDNGQEAQGGGGIVKTRKLISTEVKDQVVGNEIRQEGCSFQEMIRVERETTRTYEITTRGCC